MPTKRLDFGVENPIHISDPGEYDWNVWRREAKKDVWLGFFCDAATALAWVKHEGDDRLVVNNVPPATSRRYVAGPVGTGNTTGAPRIQPKPEAPVAAPSRAVRKPVAAKPVRQLTAEEQELRDAANAVIDQHVRDEQEEDHGND